MLRLDQMADIYALGEAAQAGTVVPSEGLERLAAIRRQKARFGWAGLVFGHGVLALGLAMVQMPTGTNLVAAAILGLIVGLLKIFNRGRSMLSVPLPVVAAAAVSMLVFLAMRRGIPVDPLHVLVRRW